MWSFLWEAGRRILCLFYFTIEWLLLCPWSLDDGCACCWLRKVSLPEPSTFTRYWSCPGVSTTTPDLSHLVGFAPCWFWRKTLSLTANGLRVRECSFRDSIVRVIRVQRASSFVAYALHQVGRTLGSEYFSCRLTNENVSLSGRPKMIWAGDMLQSGSGVLRSCSIARRKLSLLRLPVGPVLDCSRRFAVLTATSALPFDWGKWAEDRRCLMPQWLRKFAVWPAVNSGPPSLESYSGTPKVAKNDLRWRIIPAAPARLVPAAEPNTSTQPERRLPTTR